jgi:hypothetical protein
MTKMYIVIKKSLPSHKAVSAAHASLMCHLKFFGNQDYIDWLNLSFRKVVVEATDEEFENLKQHRDYVVVIESNLDDVECALAFCPREWWPEQFKTLPLLKV